MPDLDIEIHDFSTRLCPLSVSNQPLHTYLQEFIKNLTQFYLALSVSIMVRYPPAKLGARKRTIIDLIDDDDRGTPVQDSIPSVRREDKPRRRKPRMPPGAKADTSEAKKNEICDTKQSLQSEPKVFIKATESRVKEGILEEAKNDASSYALGLTTYVEQAEREPDFIGDAFYYNLTKATVRVSVLRL